MPLKLAVDAALTLLFVLLSGFHHTGGLAHEWIGMAFFGLVIMHNILNSHWYKSVLKGAYGLRRGMNAFLNGVLLTDMAILCISGICNSSHVFKALELDGELWLRQVHSFAAYWGLIICGVHIGMHWKMVVAAAYTMCGVPAGSHPVKKVLRLGAWLLALYGIWAFFDRNMGEKLFHGAAFDFWSPDRPVFEFYASNMAILWLCASITSRVRAL